MDSWYLTHNCDLGEGEVSVTLYPAGDSTVFVTQNWGEQQEIGHYKFKLSEQQCLPIRNALRATNYAQQSAGPGLPPESATMAFGEGVAGELPTVMAWALPDVPPPIRAVAMDLRPLIDEIVKYPLRTLRGSATLLNPTPASGDPVELEVVLRNSGIEAVQFHTPSHATSEGLVRLALTVAKDKPPQLLTESDVDEVEIARSELQIVSDQGAAIHNSPPLTTLGPDEELRIRIKKRGYLAPGSYRAVLKIALAAGNISPEQTVEGTLTMTLGALNVK